MFLLKSRIMHFLMHISCGLEHSSPHFGTPHLFDFILRYTLVVSREKLCYNYGIEVILKMKKILAIAILCALMLALTACSSGEPSADPLIAKWVAVYNEGASKILFSFEDVGDLDITIWHYDEAQDKLVQAEDYAATYTRDPENSTVTATIGEESHTFGYSIVEKESITLTFDESELTLDYVESNTSHN